MDNVRNVRRSILVTRAPEDLEGVESDLEDMLRPPRPITPTPSLLSQVSTGSSSTLSEFFAIQMYNNKFWPPMHSTIVSTYIIYNTAGGQSTPNKFQRTPRHSMVFDTDDTAKVT